ncbi:hypothetical protein SPRG_21062 [Saprolegnia parasitica CBS 223.65]|uniref:Man1/Src1-like C-terminal domain-containing protein n=1 Tax=Saprolegnia parasitica (strain CBS 223.65) TaxID=695850 RepID=A0A067C1P8_SAPPC|nr:hypothetical protein SPRG_21062 [Saprolegnia parasitica CBS 223.65]KDO23060.1 hypothetical protein SPRG_21062 [Saprolegnia parasitica CBS 223.65]|eukprot:XP_012206239.1 hypothetical protein SPRG_21062 [Saprolegnia parasitica CBS 223.65]
MSSSLAKAREAAKAAQTQRFGHCHSGELHSCREPYVLVERRCVESDQVRQDAHLMAELIDSFLMRRASSAFCNGSWVDLLLFGNDDGSSQQIVVSATEQIGYLRNQANWKESSDVVFVAAYSKATTQLAAQSSTRFFQDDGQVALTVLDASALCWTVLELHEHLYIYASTFFGALGVLYLYSQVQQSKYRKLLFTKMLQAVHGELRRLEESDNVLDGAVDGLRREILERFFPHASDSREATRLWTSIAAHVQRDARVRERHVMHRGQQVLVWEWIDARRQTATRVEPPLVAGQAVNYSTTSY